MILFALGIAIAAGIGHISGFHSLANWGDNTDMAINTVTCFMLITVALLLRSHRSACKPDTKHVKHE